VTGSIGSVPKKKGQEICTVAPDATVHDAVALMAAKNVSAILVIPEDTFVGILSARDYGRKVILEGKSSRDLQVQEIMTTSVITATPATTVLDAMEIMTGQRGSFTRVLEFEKQFCKRYALYLHRKRPAVLGQ
jgi:CBS domain-containing protein